MKHNRLKQFAEREGRPPKQILIELYERHGNQTGVAAELGLSQSRLSVLLKEHNLKEKRILVESQEQAS